MIRLLLTAFLFLVTLTTYAQSDIVVYSTNPTNEYTEGEVLTFTLTVTNNGPDSASNVHVYYAIPPGLLPIPNGYIRFWWTGSNGTSGTNVDLDTTILTLGVNQTVSYTINIKFPSEFTDELDDVQVTYDSHSDIEVVNTNGQTNYTAGTQSVYTVTVTNNGPEDAANVEVQNLIPAGITGFSWVGDNGSSGTDVNLNDTIASLPVGSTVTYTITLDVPAGYTNAIASTFSYSGVDDPTPTCEQCTDIDYPDTGADIVVVNTDGQDVYTAGTPSVYTITVSNNGTVDADNVEVAFFVPATVATVAWVGDNGSSGTIADLTDSIGTLAVGDTVTYTVTVDVPAAFTGDFTVSTVVTTTSPDTDGTCPLCSDTDYETASADIVVVNTNGQEMYTPGSSSVYTVTVTNNGPTAAANVQVNNAIPAGITNFSWTGDNGTSGTNTDLADTIASLAAGETVTYTITLDVPAGYTGLLTSETTVTSDTPDPDPSCDACADTDSDTPLADLVVTKTLNSGTTYTAGLDAVYTITVENMGPTEAQNINVSDVIPAGIDPATVTWTGSNGTSGTGNLTDVVATLAVGDVVTYQLVMPVPSNFDQAANIVNEVVVTSDTPDPNPDCPDCIHTATPNPLANLMAVKTNGQTTYVSNTQTIYTITVTNPGPSDAINVVVYDQKPYQVTLMTWTGNEVSGTGNLNNTIPVLPAGESVVYEVIVNIPENYHSTVGPLQNVVSVTSDTPDPVPGCPTCTDIDQPGSIFVVPSTNLYTVPELVKDVLIDVDCVEVDNITWSTGVTYGQQSNGIAYFESNNADFPIQNGVVLTSGRAVGFTNPDFQNSERGIGGPNDILLSNGGAYGWAGDDDLLPYMDDPDDTSYDATSISFDFVPLSDSFTFNFLFASEEYSDPGFECTYTDVFAFILTDLVSGEETNLAVVPGTDPPVNVSVTTIHLFNNICGAANPDFFGQYNIDDDAPTAAINFNGQTVVMQASATVIPDHPYSIKLAISNANDNSWNSAVFLEAGSFNIGQPVLPDDLTLANGGALCPGGSVVISAVNDDSTGAFNYQWERNGELVLDEEGQPVTTDSLTVTEPGVYTLQASFVSSPDCFLEDSVRIEFQPEVDMNDPIDLIQCGDITAPTQTFDLTQNTDVMADGYPSLQFYYIYYYESLEDIDANNYIFDPSAYEGTTGQTIYVTVQSPANNCYTLREFQLEVVDCDVPIDPLDPIAVCEPQPYDNVEIFDLTQYEDQVTANLVSPEDYVITYYNSEGDAEAAVAGTEIADPVNYSGTNEIVYIRVQHIVLEEAYNIVPLELIVTPIPEVILPTAPYEACINDGYILPALTIGSYFTGPSGTGTQLNAGDVIAVSQTVYVYAVSGTAPYTCDNEDSFEVVIHPLPTISSPITNYVQCDQTDPDANDGIEEFDLTTKDTEITGGNVD
ncbi:DUF11 domain-containing protein, partial [Flavobacterium rakeshii]